MHKKEKLKVIADPIYGSIPFTNIEADVLSTRIYNRLHNILQDSMAYMVYPSNKTSRFSHSIGVMKNASEIFKYGIVNANRETRKEFIREFKEEFRKYVLKKLLAELKDIKLLPKKRGTPRKNCADILNISEECDIETFEETVIKLVEHYLEKDKAILLETPAAFENREIVYYQIILQSLRLAGLLHDVGHLPFSHISEFIIENIYDSIKTKREKTKVDEIILEILEPYLEIRGDKSGKRKIHEVLTRDVIEYIFDIELADTLDQLSRKWSNREYRKYCEGRLYYKLFKIMVLNILWPPENSNVFRALYKIISGDLDADRLDFVKRDGTVSGLLEGTGRVDRIIKLYRLVMINSDNGGKKFQFMPSIQALNDIEQLLTDRFRVYKYLIGHHKVVRFDYLLEKSVRILFEKEISKLANEERELNKRKFFEYLKNNEDTILRLIAPLIKIEGDPENDLRERIYLLFQIDDYWLLHVLRSEYVELLQKAHNDRYTNDENTSEDLEFILDELFTNSKRLVSLWKRDEDFHNFIKGFIQKYHKDILRVMEEEIAKLKKLEENANELDRSESIDKELKNDLSDIMYFTKTAIKHYENLQCSLNDNSMLEFLNWFVSSGRLGWRYFVFKLENHFQEEALKSGIISHRNQVLIASVGHKLKVGIDSSFCLYSESSLTPEKKFSEVSPTVSHLRQKQLMSKPFEVYYHKELHEDKEKIIELLSKKLNEEILNQMRSLRQEYENKLETIKKKLQIIHNSI